MPTPSTPRRARAQAPERALHVYDGRQFVGVIRERAKKITAFTTTGRDIGTYRSRRAAVRAIPSFNRLDGDQKQEPARFVAARVGRTGPAHHG